jgi:hypothetical protein
LFDDLSIQENKGDALCFFEATGAAFALESPRKARVANAVTVAFTANSIQITHKFWLRALKMTIGTTTGKGDGPA